MLAILSPSQQLATLKPPLAAKKKTISSAKEDMAKLQISRMEVTRRSALQALGVLVAVAILSLGAFFYWRDVNRGIVVHKIESAYQSGPVEIRVLLPERVNPTHTYPVVYVLPVVSRREPNPYGDGLAEVRKYDLQNRYQAVFVAPTFSATPWYADNPESASIRQESYVLRTVLPFVEEHYPVARTKEGRFLLGFSKSGWGAWTLLLRSPEVFARAVAWDAPMMLEELGPWDTPAIFGSAENFRKYRLTDLVATKGQALGNEPRLLMIGYGAFKDHHERMDRLLTQIGVPHTHIVGVWRKHDWRSGWVPESVELLLAH